MSTAILGLSLVAAMFALLLLRVPVWLALALVGITGNIVLSNVSVAQFIAGSTTFDMASKYGLSVSGTSSQCARHGTAAGTNLMAWAGTALCALPDIRRRVG